MGLSIERMGGGALGLGIVQRQGEELRWMTEKGGQCDKLGKFCGLLAHDDLKN